MQLNAEMKAVVKNAPYLSLITLNADGAPHPIIVGGKELDGMDYIVARKVLKKLESMNITFVRDEIRGLIEYIGDIFIDGSGAGYVGMMMAGEGEGGRA